MTRWREALPRADYYQTRWREALPRADYPHRAGFQPNLKNNRLEACAARPGNKRHERDARAINV